MPERTRCKAGALFQQRERIAGRSCPGTSKGYAKSMGGAYPPFYWPSGSAVPRNWRMIWGPPVSVPAGRLLPNSTWTVIIIRYIASAGIDLQVICPWVDKIC